MSAPDHSASAASVVLQNQGVIAATLSHSAGMVVPASEKRAAPPRMAYLHDTRTLIDAIWPDAPPGASLDDIATKARAHREIFETYGERIATLAPPEDAADAQACAFESGLDAARAGVQGVFADPDSALEIDGTKPVCRIAWFYDGGDSSVGMAPSAFWMLAGDQSGTVFHDLLNAAGASPGEEGSHV